MNIQRSRKEVKVFKIWYFPFILGHFAKITKVENNLFSLIFSSSLSGSEGRETSKARKNRLKQFGKLFENLSFFERCIYGHIRRFGAHNFTSNCDKVVKQKQGCFLHSRQLKHGTIKSSNKFVTSQVRSNAKISYFFTKFTQKWQKMVATF